MEGRAPDPRGGRAGIVGAGRALNNLPSPRVFMGELRSNSDGALYRRAVDGDEDAFGELVRRYSRPAYAVALSVTGKHADAEDAVQDGFIAALERLEQCRDPEKFGGWLLTAVRNRARNLVRRESLRETDPVPRGASSSRRGPAGDLEMGRLRDRLTDALEQLTEVQKEVVLLHDLEGWKHREIAEHLEMPSGTVRSHLHFARKRLRKILGPDEAASTEEES